MRCIFCKEISNSSKSVEHIIPESLGNKSHILKDGIVCDKCNNYFSIKIEKEVLEQPYFKNLRHRNSILTKKRKLPPQKAFLVHEEQPNNIDIINSHSDILYINVENEKLFKLISDGVINKIYIPIINTPETNNLYLSKLLGKIAIEAFADKIKNTENWNEEFVSHEGFDELRNYVRFGKGEYWPYKMRKVYEEESTDNIKKKEDSETLLQTIHEYDFLYIENKYLHFICIIMGIEYTINVGDRPLEKYEEWLKLNGCKSPLCDEIQDRKKLNNKNS